MERRCNSLKGFSGSSAVERCCMCLLMIVWMCFLLLYKKSRASAPVVVSVQNSVFTWSQGFYFCRLPRSIREGLNDTRSVYTFSMV